MLTITKPSYRVPLMSEIAAFPKNGFKAASTFSGCGGSSLGYKMAGFEVLWASELVNAAADTYRANHPGTKLDGRDIRKIEVQEVLDAMGLKAGELDLFDGSPPCASFSTAGIGEKGWGRTKKYSDIEQRTDDLFEHFIRMVHGIQPRVFVAENVSGLTFGSGKKMLGDPQTDMFGALAPADAEPEKPTIYHALCDAGYVVRYQILNARDYGVPQNRPRVIFIGLRQDLAKKFKLEPTYPAPLGYEYTLRDAIPWLPKGHKIIHDTSGERSAGDVTDKPSPAITVGVNSLCSHHYRVTGPEATDDQKVTTPPVEPESDMTKYATGAEWDKLSPGEQSEKYFSLIRTDPELPCPTICASHGSGGIAGTAHPYEKRKFSLAELRQICSFPPDFILTGSYAQRWERLGRAVPPVMMSYIAAHVRDTLLIPAKEAK